MNDEFIIFIVVLVFILIFINKYYNNLKRKIRRGVPKTCQNCHSLIEYRDYYSNTNSRVYRIAYKCVAKNCEKCNKINRKYNRSDYSYYKYYLPHVKKLEDNCFKIMDQKKREEMHLKIDMDVYNNDDDLYKLEKQIEKIYMSEKQNTQLMEDNNSNGCFEEIQNTQFIDENNKQWLEEIKNNQLINENNKKKLMIKEIKKLIKELEENKKIKFNVAFFDNIEIYEIYENKKINFILEEMRKIDNNSFLTHIIENIKSDNLDFILGTIKLYIVLEQEINESNVIDNLQYLKKIKEELTQLLNENYKKLEDEFNAYKKHMEILDWVNKLDDFQIKDSLLQKLKNSNYNETKNEEYYKYQDIIKEINLIGNEKIKKKYQKDLSIENYKIMKNNVDDYFWYRSDLNYILNTKFDFDVPQNEILNNISTKKDFLNFIFENKEILSKNDYFRNKVHNLLKEYEKMKNDEGYYIVEYVDSKMIVIRNAKGIKKTIFGHDGDYKKGNYYKFKY